MKLNENQLNLLGIVMFGLTFGGSALISIGVLPKHGPVEWGFAGLLFVVGVAYIFFFLKSRRSS